MKIEDIIKATDRYNLHSHTQFCDGRFPMEEMAASAAECRMLYYGFSPHSPICCDSPCNMSRGDVPVYIDEAARLREVYSGRMEVLTSMEIDFIRSAYRLFPETSTRLQNRVGAFRADPRGGAC